nr:filamentous hemagglutinin N-terminal domain-containing protein [Burkholderia stagnalis]
MTIKWPVVFRSGAQALADCASSACACRRKLPAVRCRRFQRAAHDRQSGNQYDPSLTEGEPSVAGPRVNFILANPKGITVNGEASILPWRSAKSVD